LKEECNTEAASKVSDETEDLTSEETTSESVGAADADNVEEELRFDDVVNSDDGLRALMRDRSLQISFAINNPEHCKKEISMSTFSTECHVVFSGKDSPLSLYNWQVEQKPFYFSGRKFAGSRAYEVFVDVLSKNDVIIGPRRVEFPADEIFSTAAIKESWFGCVAQFMFAIRAWCLNRIELSCGDAQTGQVKQAVDAVLGCQMRYVPQEICRHPLIRILRANSPLSAREHAVRVK
jgi:hypothetical protein